MKPKLTLLFTLVAVCMMTVGQRSDIELTFTAVNNTTHVQLDSIKIMNRAQGGDTVLYWPDTVLSSPLGITDILNGRIGFQLLQNYPNPVGDQTTINLTVPDHDQVTLIFTDVLGRTVYRRDLTLSRGTHALLFTPGKESAYFLSAFWRGERQTIKILHYSNGHQKCLVEYTGFISSAPEQKSSAQAEDFIINPGDELLYIGYAAGLESGILDKPEGDSTYTFQFATNNPCPGTPTVQYEGQVYNTVQIGAQCWFRENLNVGTMIVSNTGGFLMTDNDIIEKYCYGNNEANCDIYGGLYEWPEAMQYVTTEGAQGICPVGWHIPTDNEWKILEGTVDSHYGVGDPEWDDIEHRGIDAGGNLKEAGTTHWHSPNTGATNSSGFTGYPGGIRYYIGGFGSPGHDGYFWSSSQGSTYHAWGRILFYDFASVYRAWERKDYGLSLRCLKGCWPEPDSANAGPDQANLPGTSTTLAGNTPTYGMGIWHIISGTVGMVADTTSPTSTFTGVADSTYSLSWTITTQCGSSADTVVISFAAAMGQPCPGIPTVEYEGQVYNTVQIDDQCWFRENLNVGMKINSTQGGFQQQDNGILEKYCYDNDEAYCAIYGGLYEWPEAMQYVTTEGAQGICPDGWHIATDDEWKILEGTVDSQYGVGDPEWDGINTYRGLDAGGNLKEAGTEHWGSPNSGATNSSGFTGLPGGYCSYNSGSFCHLVYDGCFWSSSQYSTNHAWDRGLYLYASGMYRDSYYKECGFSVRCLKDTP
ncbi:MAG: FISUMP domain-containing protein [Bacteroidales bacterium]|nr:FISUMP domain-containing protein [Bacteroidales bacterium]